MSETRRRGGSDVSERGDVAGGATPRRTAATFPLSAIVGQRDLVEALLVGAVAPDVGGVLVRGERGTAKSTAVRALAPLLPPVPAARGQRFAFRPGERGPDGPIPPDAPVEPRPAPLCEVPLGTSLDRLLGAIDLRRALEGGEVVFEPGLLAQAHNGILYVDEVNLLPDHLVDALLDAAASGVARVEREAVSVEHDARFLLVGTMNLEEGELRPQLLDRFGLAVTVATPRDPDVRAEIVRRRLAYDADPQAFAARFEVGERELRERIARARDLYPQVELGARELQTIVRVCAELAVDGARGDIVAARTARALAALAGRTRVTSADVERALALALPHRLRRDPLADGAGDASAGDLAERLSHALGEAARETASEASRENTNDAGGTTPRSGQKAESNVQGEGYGSADNAHQHTVSGDHRASVNELPANPSRGPAAGFDPRAAAPSDHRPPPASARPPRALLGAAIVNAQFGAPTRRGDQPGEQSATIASGGGRRARLRSGGAVVDSTPLPAAAAALAAAPAATPQALDLAVAPTLLHRRARPDAAPRCAVRAGRSGALVCLVVDASGSMGARKRLARLKGALEALLRDAYRARDRVAVVAFRGRGAVVLARPGAPLERAARAVRELPAGGRTPLAAGLRAAAEILTCERRREPGRPTVCVLATDGRVATFDRALVEAARALTRSADAVHVLDTDSGPLRLGRTRELARLLRAPLHQL